MERSLSFSRNGIQLDINLHSANKPKDRQALQKVLNSKSSITLKNIKIKPHPQTQTHQHPQPHAHLHKKGDIGRLIARSIPSSFQKCHMPVKNINAIYNQKIELTKKRHQYYSMKKFNPPSYFDTVRDFYKKEHDQPENAPCDKLTKTLTSQRFLKSQSTHGSRFETLTNRSKLLIPFEKQTQRPFYEKLRKLEEQSLLKSLPSDQTDLARQALQRLSKLKKTHKFESYSKRDLLNPQKVAQFSSQLNVHLVDLKLFKQRNNQAHTKFDLFVDKIITRYDRDSVPWVVKLQYDGKDSGIRGRRQIRGFEKQSDRKLNEVHSRYPMRIAM